MMLNVWFNHVQSLFLSPDGPNHRPIVQTGGLEQRGAERGRHRGGEGGHQFVAEKVGINCSCFTVGKLINPAAGWQPWFLMEMGYFISNPGG